MTSAPSPTARGTVLILLATLGFSFITIFTILATRHGAALTMVNLGRYGVATLTLLPALGWYRRERPRTDRVVRAWIFGSVGQSTVAVLTLAALQWIPAATLVFLFYTFPAWVAVIAAARGTEPLDRRRVTALILSLGGVAAIVGMPGADTIHPLGMTLALVGALVYAIFIPVMGRLQGDMDAAFVTLLISSGATLLFGIAALWRGELAVVLPWPAWAAIVGLGIVSTAVAFRLFLRGLREVGPVRTAILCTVEPLFVTASAALFLHQPITPAVFVGGAFILSAVALLQTRPAARTA